MDSITEKKNRATTWFSYLRDMICESLEAIETKQNVPNSEIPAGHFVRKNWERPGGGGGTMSVMEGRVFEKVGVNVSTVFGEFSEEFCKEIPGAQEDPRFWASGISFVAHPRNPHVPIAHMNTRMIITKNWWFGGGGDLTPVFEAKQDTEDFHQAFKKACDTYSPTAYNKYKEECDRYFYLTHRQEPRGVGGIFFDNLNSGNWEKDFAFVQEVGKAFATVYPMIVQRNCMKSWTQEDKEAQLQKRARYVEFNLIYDRGTQFGLKTGANIEALFMSLPPLTGWPLSK